MTRSGFTGLEAKLSTILSTYAGRMDTSEVQIALSSPARDWHWKWATPGSHDQFFFASITKLYVLALIMQLQDEGRLSLDAPASGYLGPSIMTGIHVLKGRDYSNAVTIRHLLSHTSGIADYFEQRRNDGPSTFQRLLEQDFPWSFDDVLDITKNRMQPHFAPGTKHKALYSDTNYQLLGRIIENTARVPFEKAVQERITGPLALTNSYIFTPGDLGKYDSLSPMLYSKSALRIPQAMTSFRADGGLVSTTEDGITFLQALFDQRLAPLPANDLEMETWLPILPMISCGTGMMRYKLPSVFTGFRASPPMYGHSGASGAVLFYVPELGLYLCGTVNQVKNRSMSFKLMTQLVMECSKAFK